MTGSSLPTRSCVHKVTPPPRRSPERLQRLGVRLCRIAQPWWAEWPNPSPGNEDKTGGLDQSLEWAGPCPGPDRLAWSSGSGSTGAAGAPTTEGSDRAWRDWRDVSVVPRPVQQVEDPLFADPVGCAMRFSSPIAARLRSALANPGNSPRRSAPEPRRR